MAERSSKRTLGYVAAAIVVVAIVAVVLVTRGGSDDSSSTASSGDKFQVALNLSYTGNDWQEEAANLIKAQAKTPPYNEKVDLRVDVSGTDVSKQIQTINSEVSGGADAIILYPLSPTALNSAIESACEQGVVVFAYDSEVSAPCAYNVHDDIKAIGYEGANWLGEKLKNGGDIGLITGIAGTSADTLEVEGVEEALSKYPKVNVVAKTSGEWDQAVIKSVFTQMIAAHPDLDGVWFTTGCTQVYDVLKAQGRSQILCSGGGSNAERTLMLPTAEGGENLDNFSVGTPTYNGELAFIQAVQVLENEPVAKETVLPPVAYTRDEIVLGDNPADGANVLPPTKVPPGFFDDFWSPLVEQGYKAALTGDPDKVSDAKPCGEVEGCTEPQGPAEAE